VVVQEEEDLEVWDEEHLEVLEKELEGKLVAFLVALLAHLEKQKD